MGTTFARPPSLPTAARQALGATWLFDHLSRSPRYSAYVAWCGMRSVTTLCTQLVRGQRAALLAMCETLAPSLRGLFDERGAGFWAQVFLFDEYRVGRCRLLPGALVLDVGANVGFFSWRVAAFQPRARVVAFEPEASNLAVLREVFDRLGIDGEVVGAACGAAPGRADLHLRSSVTHTLVPTHHLELASGGVQEVDVVALDGWLSAHGYGDTPVGLLKIDVEGAEVDVLRGATATLQRTSTVVLEHHGADLGRQCRHILDRAGFACRAVSYWGPSRSGTGLLFATSRRAPWRGPAAWSTDGGRAHPRQRATSH